MGDERPTPENIFPWGATDEQPHENVQKAINATDTSIANIKFAVKERKKWLYINTLESEAWALVFFQKPDNTPTRVGESSTGKRLIAIWNGDGDTPDCEPTFG